MDFFEQQEIARKKTGRLVVLFLLAVLGIIAMTYLVVDGVIIYMEGREGEIDLSGLWNWEVLLFTGLGVLLVILLGSLYKTSILSAGGRVVAESLDGVLVEPGTRDKGERRLLNVVEEMAIASGTSVPPVYLMKGEEGINAFAAGFSPDDAVIGVTRGSLEKLSRDELQGVIAHEFSHIINGDMRLNIRLMGVIHGILAIGLIGWFILRSVLYSGMSRSRRSDRGGNVLPFLLIGVSLLVIGYLGMFFGNLIKAAVSRQREFLADASAVQFTRNPRGIGGVLRKIMGLDQGSKMENAHAVEVSHMLFSQGFSSFLQDLYATHPPLEERIRRIDPALVEVPESAGAERKAVPAAAPAAGVASGFAAGGAGERAPEATAQEASALSRIGNPAQAHLDHARQIVEGLPGRLRTAAHETYGARAVVYALLLDRRREPREKQLRQLADHADKGVHRETLVLQPFVQQLDRAARLPLTEMAISSLRELSPAQYAVFKENVLVLIRADEKVDIFEWVLHRLILHHLEPHFVPQRRTAVRYRSLKSITGDCALLLSCLAHAGHPDADAAASAFRQAAPQLGVGAVELMPADRCSFRSLDRALGKMNRLAPRRKKIVLEACAVCISADRQITVDEAELFRAVADSLGCPVPPILPGQPLADV